MTLAEVAILVGGELNGPAELEISEPVSPEVKELGGIAFAESESYLEIAEQGGAVALLLPRSLRGKKPFIHVDNPRAAFFALLQRAEQPLSLNPGVHATAIVDPTATVDPSAQVGPYAVIERGARIGAGCRVYPFAYIGENCDLGAGCAIFPHAVLYTRVRLGERVIVHAGAVLGADGFGYVWDGSKRLKVPQVGAVVIESDCEIGALTAIDRATVGETRVGPGTKIDNLVQIAHNVEIGSHCAIASQVGIAGSTKVGDRVMAGGQSGSADHMVIGNDVVLTARAAVLQSIESPGEYMGFPARPSFEAKKVLLLTLKLPELFARLKKLEKRANDR